VQHPQVDFELGGVIAPVGQGGGLQALGVEGGRLDLFDDRAAEPGRTAELRAFVAAHRGGTVPMMVTHQVNITAATGLYAGFGQVVAVPADGGPAFALAPIG